MLEPIKWMDRIACAGVDLDDFVNEYGSTEKAREFARQYCAVCPVLRECLDFGVRTDSEGIFGGFVLRPHSPNHHRRKVRLL